MKSRMRRTQELEAKLDRLRQKRAWGWETEEERDRLSAEIERVMAEMERLDRSRYTEWAGRQGEREPAPERAGRMVRLY